MAFELRHFRGLRTILLSCAVVAGCAAQGAEDDDAPVVLHHDGHAHAPATATQTVKVDAGVVDAGAPGCADTYEGIQATIFDSKTYNCSNASCHGSPGGHIDLRKGFSYDSLLGLEHEEGDAHAHAITTLEGFDVLHHEGEDHGDGHMVHVVPGEPEKSVLYDNLRAKLEGIPTKLGGTPMPLGPGAVSKDQLKAVELWIKAGAPRTGFVAGTEAVCVKGAPAVDAGRPYRDAGAR